MKRSFAASLAVGIVVAACLVGCQSPSEETRSASDDRKKAEGTWTLVSGESDGEPLPEQILRSAKLTIVGDSYTVELGELGVKKGTQELDSTKSPKQIEAQDADPSGGRSHGIYEFTANGDYRVCFAAPGKERPTEFATKPGSGTFMHVWRKTKSE